MLVDFYQLGGLAPEKVISSFASKILAEVGRLLIVSEGEAVLSRLDRLLWSEDSASFLPHGIAGGADDARQPVLLSTSEDSPNGARNMLIVDGQWMTDPNNKYVEVNEFSEMNNIVEVD